MIVGIIPAKSVSDRLKNKNFKKFNGKPMIAWTIETALKSKLFDKIIVSTDDVKVKKILKKYKIEIIIRPKKLNKEKYGIIEIINYNLEKIRYKVSAICCLFPCAPLMQAQDIKRGYKKLILNKCKFVFAASIFSHPVEKSFKLKNNKIKMIFNEKFVEKSSKFLSKTYHDVGYFYWGKTNTWRKNKWSYNSKVSFIEIPHWRAQDLDTLDDWKKTDLIFKSLNRKNINK